MTRLLAALLAICLAVPVAAHGLRVFATVEGSRVTGYGFFIGGGRPQGARWTAREGARRIAGGTTGADGGFAFEPDAPPRTVVTVTIDAGDGHQATATLPPARFGVVEAGGSQAPAPAGATAARRPDADETALLVEAAVARQVAPLLERIERMDARLRLTDVLSGVFLILGLAGVALWLRGRRT